MAAMINWVSLLFINMESIPKGRNDCQILLTMTVNLHLMNDNMTIIRNGSGQGLSYVYRINRDWNQI